MCFEFVNLISKTISKAMITILGCVSNEPRKVKREKEKHEWSLRTMHELIQHSSVESFADGGTRPRYETFDLPPPEVYEIEEISKEEKHIPHLRMMETPILIATKNGITEIVEFILERFPLAMDDMNWDGKNIFLLAIENRQPHLYKLLLEKIIRTSIFRAVDNDGNTALHLAAKLGSRSWIIPGLKMQWEIKWYQFVKESMPLSFWAPYNKDGLTADEVFMNTHSDLVKDDIQWLMKTSDSCTIVTALIATVAFATSASVPGGVNGQNGEPVLRQERMFDVFSISSLFALCFSLIALITFLAILTTQHQAMDFRRKVPMLLLMGLTTLFMSIASMVVSFCGGHFFILKGVLRDASVVEYLVALLPLIIFVTVQFPLYFNVLRATITKVPERHYVVTT
ncbi:uncharacterized protein LOC114318833 [Camellia sinensis]|uniref:uncharacterized protein LOC114318833 n=1 Tax=Camellia sinensis TaxID=4442 RepID=UPI0010356068|nr:uncharacterized protein LOC114318833 [Camellia sinensis]